MLYLYFIQISFYLIFIVRCLYGSVLVKLAIIFVKVVILFK